jgi:signal transduction histidine kinase
VTEIVNSLGRFSRRSDDLNQICNINSIIDNCLVILNNTFKYKCTVTKEYCDEKLEVTGNEGKLHQVFINILNNSIQAIEKNGTLHISTNIAENNCALIIIRDNGSGILPEHINKIFDPFFTTKEPGKGTGLGLSIVYSIIKEHNGFITYKSEINRGTEVKILLPLRLK